MSPSPNDSDGEDTVGHRRHVTIYQITLHQNLVYIEDDVTQPYRARSGVWRAASRPPMRS
jgi:hypothetical protein